MTSGYDYIRTLPTIYIPACVKHAYNYNDAPHQAHPRNHAVYRVLGTKFCISDLMALIG